MKANLRCCASCDWIFKSSPNGEDCPMCGFGHYSARYVYGKKCYSYYKSQQPWLDKKIELFERLLLKIISEKSDYKPPPRQVFDFFIKFNI